MSFPVVFGSFPFEGLLLDWIDCCFSCTAPIFLFVSRHNGQFSQEINTNTKLSSNKYNYKHKQTVFLVLFFAILRNYWKILSLNTNTEQCKYKYSSKYTFQTMLTTDKNCVARLWNRNHQRDLLKCSSFCDLGIYNAPIHKYIIS